MPTMPRLCPSTRIAAGLLLAALAACSKGPSGVTLEVPAKLPADWKLSAPTVEHVSADGDHALLFHAGEASANAKLPLPTGIAGVERVRLSVMCDGRFSLRVKAGDVVSGDAQGENTARQPKPLDVVLPRALDGTPGTLELERVSAQYPVLVLAVEFVTP